MMKPIDLTPELELELTFLNQSLDIQVQDITFDYADKNGHMVDPDNEKLTVGQIMRRHLPWILSNPEFNAEQKKTGMNMAACGTEECGCFVDYCPNCKKATTIRYGSCGDRNCNRCGSHLAVKWITEQAAMVIPDTDYFHIVLTAPHDLNPIIAANRKLLLNALFHASSSAVIEIHLNRSNLGYKPGIISEIHTWTQTLEVHNHVHLLVTGGGLNPDKKYVRASSGYLLPLEALTDLFRNKYIAEIRDLYKQHKLRFPGTLDYLNDPYEWNAFCTSLSQTSWVGFIGKAVRGTKESMEKILFYFRRPPIANADLIDPEGTPGDFSPAFASDNLLNTTNAHADFYTASCTGVNTSVFSTNLSDPSSDPDVFEVLRYFSQYANKAAFCNSRITKIENNTVTFLARDPADKKNKKEITLSEREFISRYLQHVLPRKFNRIRCSGIFANCSKKKNLDLIFMQLTGNSFTPSPVKEKNGVELLKDLFPNGNLGICPHCGKQMISLSLRKNADPCDPNNIVAALKINLANMKRRNPPTRGAPAA